MRLMTVILLALYASGWAVELEITSQPPLPAPNLLQNPGIEQGENGEPTVWRWGTAVPDNFVTAWGEDGRSGKCLYLKAHSGVMSGYWNQSVSVEPATGYVMTGWFRLGGGRLLCYAHGRGTDARNVDQRFYASSSRNHFLVPVFLKPEYMGGCDAEAWYPLRVPFTTTDKLEWIAISVGMYFHAGEVRYDDLSVFRAKTDLMVRAKAEAEGLRRVRVLAQGAEEPVFDSGELGDDVTSFEKSLPGVSTEDVYVLEVTTRDGEVQTKSYPEGVGR